MPEYATADYLESIDDFVLGESRDGEESDAALFGFVKKAVKKAAKAASSAASAATHAASSAASAASSALHAAQSGVSAITSNPAWDIAKTGASLIPGVGTAVSSGMAAAAAVGRGESVKDVALAAARGAIPGGPVAQAGFDVAVGVLRGQRLDDAALSAVRSQLPGGDVGKAAFDAGLAVARGQHLDDAVVNAIRSHVPAGARAVFDATIDAAKRHAAAAHVHPYPQLGLRAANVANALHKHPALRKLPVTRLVSQLGVPAPSVRDAVAAFVSRFGEQEEFSPRDVADFDSAESVASRLQIAIPAGLHAAPKPGAPNIAAAVSSVKAPRLPVTRAFLLRLYERAPSNVRKAMLVHGHLAAVARNAGELVGSEWVIRSGDTAYAIAAKLTGSGARWKELLASNPSYTTYTDKAGSTQIKPWAIGQKVAIPSAWLPQLPTPGQDKPPAQPPTTSSKGGPPFPSPSKYPNGYPTPTYVVKKNELGSTIARDITGESTRWRELLAANPKTADAELGMAIYEGQRLTLPESWVQVVSTPTTTPPIQPTVPPMPPPGDRPPTPVDDRPSDVPAVLPPGVSPADWRAAPVGGTWSVATADGTTVYTKTGATTYTAVLTPALPAPPPAQPPPAQPPVSGPPQPNAQQALALVQALLVHFNQEHADTAMRAMAFGLHPEDVSGVWTDRTRAAMQAFQAWANANRNAGLPVDGMPDDKSVAVLKDQTDIDLAKGGPPGLKNGVPIGGKATSTDKPPPAAPPSKKSGGGTGPLVLAAIAGKALGFF